MAATAWILDSPDTCGAVSNMAHRSYDSTSQGPTMSTMQVVNAWALRRRIP